MGYIRHHTMIVCSRRNEHLELAHAKACEIFGRPYAEFPYHSVQLCSEITPPAMNGTRAFFIAPDGAKRNGGLSDQRDQQREEFIQWLKENDLWVNWVEVVMYDDLDDPYIVNFPAKDV